MTTHTRHTKQIALSPLQIDGVFLDATHYAQYAVMHVTSFETSQSASFRSSQGSGARGYGLELI